MISIELKDVLLTAYHGIFEGEQYTGNPYLVSLCVKYDEGSHSFDEVDNTINYAELFELVKKWMGKPEGLLEKVCMNIMNDLRTRYPFSKEAEISIYKLQAPIEGLQGKVGVSLKKNFDG